MAKEWETTTVGGRKVLRRRPVRYHAGDTTTATASVTVEASVDEPGAYDDMTKAELIEEADARGLDTSGNKPDILARIEADDDAA